MIEADLINLRYCISYYYSLQFQVQLRALRKKQFDKSSCQNKILEAEKDFHVKYLFALVDMNHFTQVKDLRKS